METHRPQLWGNFGMVAAADSITAATGMAMLEADGNAFDAAVAAGFMLQVVQPHMCGPGGEVPVIFASVKDGRPRVLCGQGPAPQAASVAHFTTLGIDMVPNTGLLPAAVPGAFDAWMLLLRDYGTRTLRDVLSPAIRYAERGYPLLPDAHHLLTKMERTFRDHWPTSASVYLRTGTPPRPFTMYRNPTLARTFSRVLDEAETASGDRVMQIDAARRVWYQGFVAQAIDEFGRTPQPDASGVRHAGLLTAEDLSRYQATYDDPVSLDWHGWTVCKPGPWSQGPVMLQHLAILDYPEPLIDAAYIHHVVEAAKLAYADRDAYYGDVPGVPLGTLLSADYAAERRRLIADSASRELRPGRVDGRTPRLPRLAEKSQRRREGDEQPVDGRRPVPSRDTCHLDVIDRFGNLVSATPSGGYFMGSPIIDKLGFPLGNRLEMTWLEEGLPNTLQPGRRPRTTLSPTLALRDGEPVLAFGSPGADLQEQHALAFFLGLVSGMPPQEAVERPRWFTKHLIGSLHPHEVSLGNLLLEEAIADDVVAELRQRGHDVVVIHPPYRVSGVCAVGRDDETGLLYAAADIRGNAYACGR